MTERKLFSDGNFIAGKMRARGNIDEPDEDSEIEIRKGAGDPDLWIYLDSCATPARNLWPTMSTEIGRHWPDQVADVFGDLDRKIYSSTEMIRCTDDFIGM